MKYVLKGLVVLCCAITFHVQAQSPKVLGPDYRAAIYLNGLIYTGMWANDFRMTCIDTAGNLIWQRTYGGTKDEWLNHVYHVNEFGDDYLLWCGNTQSFEPPFPNMPHIKGYVVKTNLFGDTVWTRVYDRAGDVNFCLANDSNYIFSLFNSYGSIIKVDRNTGDTLWTRKNIWQVGIDIGLNNNVGAIYNSGDGFYVSGSTYPVFNAKIKLMKTDTLGHALWIKAYGDTIPNIGQGMAPFSNLGFILFGWTAGDGNQGDTLSYNDFNVLRVNLNGDTVWTKRYCHLNWPDRPYIVMTDNVDFLIAGRTWDRQAGKGYDLIIRIDSLGNLIWSKKYNLGSLLSLNKLPIGYLFSSGYLHMLDSAGNDCTAEPATITVAHSMITIDSIVPYDSSGLEFYMSPPTQEFTSTIPVTDYCLYLNAPEISKNANGFSVFPNPADKEVVIYRDENIRSFKFLGLYDTFSRLIMDQSLPGGDRISLAIGHLQNGLYFIRLWDNHGNNIIKKLVIQRE